MIHLKIFWRGLRPFGRPYAVARFLVCVPPLSFFVFLLPMLWTGATLVAVPPEEMGYDVRGRPPRLLLPPAPAACEKVVQVSLRRLEIEEGRSQCIENTHLIVEDKIFCSAFKGCWIYARGPLAFLQSGIGYIGATRDTIGRLKVESGAKVQFYDRLFVGREGAGSATVCGVSSLLRSRCIQVGSLKKGAGALNIGADQDRSPADPGRVCGEIALANPETSYLIFNHNKKYSFGEMMCLPYQEEVAQSATITGPGKVRFLQGTTTLLGRHPYSGTAGVQGGTLVLAGDLPAAALFVDAQGKLEGGGKIEALRSAGQIHLRSAESVIEALKGVELCPGNLLRLDIGEEGMGRLEAVQGQIWLDGHLEVRACAERLSASNYTFNFISAPEIKGSFQTISLQVAGYHARLQMTDKGLNLNLRRKVPKAVSFHILEDEARLQEIDKGLNLNLTYKAGQEIDGSVTSSCSVESPALSDGSHLTSLLGCHSSPLMEEAEGLEELAGSQGAALWGVVEDQNKESAPLQDWKSAMESAGPRGGV